MTHEQPSKADLQTELVAKDPRLNRAFKSALTLYQERKPNEADLFAAVDFANALQTRILKDLGIEGAKPREIDLVQVAQLAKALQGTGGKVILMRHGTQQIAPDTKELKGATQKIRLMQVPHNREDPLTDVSLAETAGTAYIFRFLSTKLGKPITVKSSENTRAAEVAAFLSYLTNAPAEYDKRLTCVNYPQLPDETIDSLLGEGSNGGLAWNKSIVDAVTGEGSYDRITRDINSVIEEGLKGEGIRIYVTHTQQTNAADLAAGAQPTRLSELGMRVFGHNRQSTLLSQGIYA